jgi:hypothetical protein
MGQARDDEPGGNVQHLRTGDEQGGGRNRPEQGQRGSNQGEESPGRNRDQGDQEMRRGDEE